MKPSLRTRMLLAYLPGTVLLIAAMAIGMVALNRVIGMYEKDMANLQEARAESMQLLAALRTQQLEWQSLLLRGQEEEQRERHWRGFEQQEKLIQEKTARLLGRLPAGDARAALKLFGDAHRQAAAGYRKGLASYQAASFDPRFGDQVVAGIDRVPNDALEKATGAIAKASADFAAQAAFRSQGARELAVTLVGALAAASVMLFLLITHFGVLAPFRDLVSQIRRLAAGDTGQPVSTYTRGELAELAFLLEEVRLRMELMLAEARASTAALAGTSLELKSAAETVIGNMEAGSQSLAALAAATDRMVASLHEVADGTLAVRDSARNALARTQTGKESLQALMLGLQNINRQLGEMSKSMCRFVAGTRCIEGMGRKITDLSGRTNLLAVNLSLECNRAGPQGRAFGAVAEELRNLAKESQRAALGLAILTQRQNDHWDEMDQSLQGSRARLTASLAEGRAIGEVLAQAREAAANAADGVAQAADALRERETGFREVTQATLRLATGHEGEPVGGSRMRDIVERLHLHAHAGLQPESAARQG